MTTKVTILGAGIMGMMIANQLPCDYEVTIYGKVLPGDDSKEWASPYAGACWVGVHDSTPYEQHLQLEGYAGLWRLAAHHPESGAQRKQMTEIMDHGTKEQVWYAHKLPGFRFLSQEELPAGAKFGMKYQTIVMDPHRFVVWMRARLEAKGVQFKRAIVSKLADLQGLGHDVLINASGLGSRDLLDVHDADVVPARMQVILARVPNYDALYIHRGPGGYYSTAFARGDGTVWVGGILTYGDDNRSVSAEERKLLAQRAHKEQPTFFPSPNVEDWSLIGDHVGIYPVVASKTEHIKVREEVVDKQRIFHAYAPNFGAYVCGFGVGRDIARRIGDYVHSTPIASRL